MVAAARRVIRLLAPALLLGIAVPVAAVPWTVVPAQSRIGFTATWLGKPVPGTFRVWSAAIDFDPAALAKARIAVTIDLASAASGDRTVDGALPGPDWFATGSGRNARFIVSRVTGSAGRFVASGALTLRGRTVPVVMPFTYIATGGTATVVGQVSLDRRSWNIGLDSDATAEYVAFAVPVTVRIVARRGR